MKTILLALALVSFTACFEPPPLADVSVDAGVATGTATQDIGTSLQCSNVCTPTSPCDQGCIDDITGFGTSCGKHGVCTSCDQSCSTATPCDFACVRNQTLTTCHGADDACQVCSPATCQAIGCGHTCMAQVVADPLVPTPTFHQYETCDAYGASIGDADDDGLPDALEDALARRFLPNVYLSGMHSNDNQGQLYATDLRCNGDPLCRMPYVVRKVGDLGGSKAGWCAQGQCAEIIYALPYSWDTGATFGIEDHRGDSEHVALLVAYKRADNAANGGNWGTTWTIAQSDASQWRLVGAFYAAHQCAGSFWDESRFVWSYTGGTYSQTALADVYASDGKHASYPSSGACDSGFPDFDSCPSPTNWRAWILDRLFNVGESRGGTYSTPGKTCAGFAHTIAYPATDTTSPPIDNPPYDVWGAQPFGSSDAQPYALWMAPGATHWGTNGYACPP